MNTRALRTALCALALLLYGFDLVFAQAVTRSNAPAEGTGWRVDVYPVMAWLPLYGVDMTVPPAAGQPPCDCGSGANSGHASSSLNGAWFAALRIEKGRFALSADFNYAGLTAEKETPFVRVKADVTTGAVAGGFRIADAWYVDAGARWHGVDLTAAVLSNPEVNWKPGGWEPAIGTTFRPRLAKRWRLYAHFDVGGFGGNAFSTVNGIGRAEWRPLKHFGLTFGYGFGTIGIDGEVQAKPIHASQTLHGPLFGIDIPF